MSNLSRRDGAMAACLPAGFVMVKKVPGTLHFAARSEGHSFDHSLMNMTHLVHQFYIGAKPTPRKYQVRRPPPPLAEPACKQRLPACQRACVRA